jgi:uncharacterized protein YecE (DUF72 family)
MFGGAPPRLGLAELDPRFERWADRLPQQLRMGTSSWTFEGWAGLLYEARASARAIREHGLGTYARHPLIRGAGVDRTFHSPMSREQLEAYRAAVPEDFTFLFKAHQDLTFPSFPNVPRFGARAGRANPCYLDTDYALKAVVEPIRAVWADGRAVVLFQFPPQGSMGGARGFADRLGEFLSALPPGPRYAVEIRNADLFTPRYLKTLREAGVLHCINGHPSMPPMERQFEVTGSGDRDYLLVRWMLARSLDYGAAKQRYSPYDRVVDVDPGSRSALVRMIQACSAPTLLIVNNNAEGCALGSISAIAGVLAQGGGSGPPSAGLPSGGAASSGR